jgi:sugar phosphate isomerase/epimerase
VHLPTIQADEDESLGWAVHTARFAAQAGAQVVIFKADGLETYARTAGPFLDAIEELPLKAVITNHTGGAIESPDDFRQALDRIGDPRMLGLFEVGHFHQSGYTWQEGASVLGERIGLVHLKDVADGECVPFGEGEVDFPALFAHMRSVGYAGDYVIELEGRPRDEDAMGYLAQSARYLSGLLGG